MQKSITQGFDTISEFSSDTREKKLWVESEDQMLIAQVEAFKRRYGARYNWTEIANHMPGRTREQCRKRWKYKLDPQMTREQWTAKDDETLLKLQATFGNRWAKIGMLMNSRSDVEVKNHFFVLQRKNRVQDLFRTTTYSVPNTGEPQDNTMPTKPTNNEKECMRNSYPMTFFVLSCQSDTSAYRKIMDNNRPPKLIINNT